jgi:hypothetical protein
MQFFRHRLLFRSRDDLDTDESCLLGPVALGVISQEIGFFLSTRSNTGMLNAVYGYHSRDHVG